MKKALALICVLLSVNGIAQQGQFSELSVQNGLQVPRFNTLPSYGKQGAVIFVYASADSGYYVRSYDGSRWIKLGWNVALTSVGINLGTSGTDLNISGSPLTSNGTITLNVPNASATARGVVNTTTQTFAGAKTFANTTTIQSDLNFTKPGGSTNTITFGPTFSSTVGPVLSMSHDGNSRRFSIAGGSGANRLNHVTILDEGFGHPLYTGQTEPYIFNIESTSRGIRLPRMTGAQQNAIANPVFGLMIYNTDSSEFTYYNGSAWRVFSRGIGGGGGGGGGISTFSSGSLNPLFTTSVATPTTTPALSFSLISQNPNRVLASPNGTSGVPLFRTLVAGDIPGLPYQSNTITSGRILGRTSPSVGIVEELQAADGVVLNGGAIKLGGTMSSSASINLNGNSLSYSTAYGGYTFAPSYMELKGSNVFGNSYKIYGDNSGINIGHTQPFPEVGHILQIDRTQGVRFTTEIEASHYLQVKGVPSIAANPALQDILVINNSTKEMQRVPMSSVASGLPAQTGNNGKVLTTNGTAARWTDSLNISEIITRPYPSTGLYYSDPDSVVYGDSTLVAKKLLDSVLMAKADTGHVHDASSITTGTLDAARLGTGTPTDGYVLTSDSGTPTWAPATGGQQDFKILAASQDIGWDYSNCYSGTTPNQDSIPKISFNIEANTMDVGETIEVALEGRYYNNTGGNTTSAFRVYKDATDWSSSFSFSGNIGTSTVTRATKFKFRFTRTAIDKMRYSFDWYFSGVAATNGFLSGGTNSSLMGMVNSFAQTVDFSVDNLIKLYFYGFNSNTTNSNMYVSEYKIIKYEVPI